MKNQKKSNELASKSYRTRMRRFLIPFFLENRSIIERIRKKGTFTPDEIDIAISILEYVRSESSAFDGVNKLKNLREASLALFSNREKDFERIIQHEPQDMNDYQLVLASIVFVLTEISPLSH
jgi:hypothetical protein